MRPIKQDFYTSQSKKLLQNFERVCELVKGPITARYGETQTGQMVQSARQEFQRLLPDLPYVGGEQPFTQFVISSGWFLALYRVMRSKGMEVQEIGDLEFQLSQTYIGRVPGYARRLLGYMNFSPRYLRKLRQRAEESQTNPYPRGYVYSFVEGDGVNFDYGVDYHQCATWTLYQEQGAEELTPYLCACDHLYSEMLHWGLSRTTTLSEGGKVCDFRFKRGAPTRVRSSVIKFVA